MSRILLWFRPHSEPGNNWAWYFLFNEQGHLMGKLNFQCHSELENSTNSRLVIPNTIDSRFLLGTRANISSLTWRANALKYCMYWVRHSKPSAYRGNATHENFDGANFFSIQIDSPYQWWSWEGHGGDAITLPRQHSPNQPCFLEREMGRIQVPHPRG
jgi:hypothetical protein